MREHLYKAKRVNWRELPKEEWWVEGLLLIDYVTGQNFIHICGNSVNESERTGKEGCLSFFAHEIDPETVCEYTNKLDDNGIPIKEEDFVKINDDWIGRIIWSERDTAFCVFPNDDIQHETYCLGYYINEGYRIEVVGNIFDNPELLKEEI